MYMYTHHIIVNLQFHHVAPAGPHQAIRLRQGFPHLAPQQLMHRCHDLRVAAALHGSCRWARDPEFQALGALGARDHWAAAVQAAKPPGILALVEDVSILEDAAGMFWEIDLYRFWVCPKNIKEGNWETPQTSG